MISLCFPYSFMNYTDEELSHKIQELCDVCQFSNIDSSKSKKDKELKLITEILYKTSNLQFITQDPYALLACAIKIVLKYSNTPLYLSNNISERKRKSRYQLAINNYTKLISMFATEKSDEIVNKVIFIIHKEKIWQAKRVCVKLIMTLFVHGFNGSVICHEICNRIEFPEPSKKSEIKLIVKVLYELLSDYTWPENDETVVFLERLLNLYFKSLHEISEESENALYVNCRGSLELCMRHIIQNLSNDHLLIVIQHMSSWAIKENVNDNVILNYGSTLEYAAYKHKTVSLSTTLTFDILSLIMQMLASTVRFVSLLGNRVFQYLIDRGKNQVLFNTPKIFFEGMQLNLRISEYNRDDRKFLKRHRELIHDSLIKSIINHKNRLSLESSYCTTCILAIEIPCGFTAAALCCIMMNLQEIVFRNQEKVGTEASYHVHAIIISVMSFVCWIHKASDFHVYVNQIVMERAQWAPHLNPPLQSHYNFAVHHVLWDKPELFFVDWEVRFGLWKRFRLNESSATKRKIKKVNLVD